MNGSKKSLLLVSVVVFVSQQFNQTQPPTTTTRSVVTFVRVLLSSQANAQDPTSNRLIVVCTQVKL